MATKKNNIWQRQLRAMRRARKNVKQLKLQFGHMRERLVSAIGDMGKKGGKSNC